MKNLILFSALLAVLPALPSCTFDEIQSNSMEQRNYRVRVGTQVCKKENIQYCNETGAMSDEDGSLVFHLPDATQVIAVNTPVRLSGTLNVAMTDDTFRELPIDLEVTTTATGDFAFEIPYAVAGKYIWKIFSVDLRLSATHEGVPYSHKIEYDGDGIWSVLTSVGDLLAQYGFSEFITYSIGGRDYRIWDISNDVVMTQD
jgi:hypothetical protein